MPVTLNNTTITIDDGTNNFVLETVKTTGQNSIEVPIDEPDDIYYGIEQLYPSVYARANYFQKIDGVSPDSYTVAANTTYATGTYNVKYSSIYIGGNYSPHNIFYKPNPETNPSWDATWASHYSNGNYVSSNNLGGKNGDWVTIQMPVKILLTNYIFVSIHYNNSTYRCRLPHKYTIFGCNNDDGNWEEIYSEDNSFISSNTQANTVFSNTYVNPNDSYKKVLTDSDRKTGNKVFNTFGLVVEKTGGWNSAHGSLLAMAEWEIYGQEIIASTSNLVENSIYKLISFTHDGSTNNQTEYTVNFPENATCDILIVGGGGGGGDHAGSGGGSGGVVVGEQITLNGTYNIKVGKGGGGVSGNVLSNNGIQSEFQGIIVLGGGGGGRYRGESGLDGGSGGGGGPSGSTDGLPNNNGSSIQSKSKSDYGILYSLTNNGERLTIYGTDGGDGGTDGAGGSGSFHDALGGGGGGAIQNGFSGNISNGTNSGKGGDGIDLSDIFGTNVGENGYFGGGGGAGGDPNTLLGLGGLGGGGRGGNDSININAKNHTGGGGGGTNTLNYSGSGGSGIVIIRYKTTKNVLLDPYDAQWTYHSDNPNVHHLGNVGIGTTNPSTALDVVGTITSTTLNATTKNFKIEHPLQNDKWLYHSSVEAPRYDNLYRGKTMISNGYGEVDIDKECNTSGGMTQGTFSSLNTNSQVIFDNNQTFDKVRGHVENGKIKIYCENTTDNLEIDWIVMGERKDKDVIDLPLTDNTGKLICEHEVNLYK